MSGGLPATIDPIQLAERAAHLTGTLPLAGMARLKEACIGGEDGVEIDLRFDRSTDAQVYEAHGVIQAALRVTCQRCLEPMMLTLTVRPQWLYVRAGEGRETPIDEAAELMEADRPVALSELVEDELLLAMPMIPMHRLEECPARRYSATGNKERRNPFADLKGRKPGTG
jgi:uncharacterized protein